MNAEESKQQNLTYMMPSTHQIKIHVNIVDLLLILSLSLICLLIKRQMTYLPEKYCSKCAGVEGV